MNRRTTALLGAAISCSALLASLPAGAAANDKLLKGEYAAVGSHGCLAAVGGFNSALEPKVPANAIATGPATRRFGCSTGPARSA
jgi:hypothetical protein